MNQKEIDERVSDLGLLEECAKNGDGDGAESHLHAEDDLLFEVLCAIADGADEPKALAAYAIQACAKEIRGRCNTRIAEASMPG